MDLAHQLDRNLQLLGCLKELVVAQSNNVTDLLVDLAHVAYSLDDVARARLALGADHRGALGNTAQRLAQIAGAADKRHVKLGLVDVIDVIGRGENLGLIDVVDLDGLKDLRLDDVADAALGHDGDGDGLLDALDHLGVAHARHTTCGTDIGRDALECHDGAGARLFGDACLLGRGDVHDDAALEHLRELAIEFDAIGLAGLFWHGCSLGWHVHCLTEHPIWELGMAKYSVFEIIIRSD